MIYSLKLSQTYRRPSDLIGGSMTFCFYVCKGILTRTEWLKNGTESSLPSIKNIPLVHCIAHRGILWLRHLFPFVRSSDISNADWICGLSAAGLCLLAFWKLIRSALKERIPLIVITLFFLLFSALLGCFLRFSYQLVDGFLDTSDPETHIVAVTSQKISPFGGSIKDGINPVAYMVYFHDWDDSLESCELRVPMICITRSTGNRTGTFRSDGFLPLPLGGVLPGLYPAPVESAINHPVQIVSRPSLNESCCSQGSTQPRLCAGEWDVVDNGNNDGCPLAEEDP